MRPLAPCALLLAACAATVYEGTGHPDLKAEASRVVEIDLADAGGRLLDLASAFGDVTVRVREGEPPGLRATLTIRGRDEEEARALLARFDVVAERRDDRVAVRRRGEAVRLPGPSIRLSPSLDVEAVVAPGQRLRIETGSGQIQLAGAAGTSELVSGFGDITVAGVRGPRLRAETGSGTIRLEHVAADAIEAATSFGDIRLSGIEGALAATTGSGDVRLEDFAGGPCALRSNFGDVTARGVFTELAVRAGSGDIDVRAAAGSRAERPWLLESNFGDVDLAVPEAFSAAVEATTSFGGIRCDAPATLTEEGKRLVATLGTGAGAVRLTAGSGDVRIRSG